MEKIRLRIHYRELPADTLTPVGIYLALRDRYAGALLLESSDSHAAENSFSFICLQPVAGIGLERTGSGFEFVLRLPGGATAVSRCPQEELPDALDDFMQRFGPEGRLPVNASGLFGFTSYEAAAVFENIGLREKKTAGDIPLLRYDLFRYVIAIDHFHERLFLCETLCDGETSGLDRIESALLDRHVPSYPFRLKGEETTELTEEAFVELAEKARAHCLRGDVFQLVLSRKFAREFSGDEFNVYRALRSINPSPYLFYFDYGRYKIFGSSPEAQLQVSGGKARIYPIAGTFRRSGSEAADRELAERLLADPKENAEHVMLVDLARNDLSRHAREVQLERFREIQYYSHVIHLVSCVSGRLSRPEAPFRLLADTFPAGTLTGAPKYRAMELIDRYEPVARGFYGGCLGFAGFDGSFNHAIIIRSFFSRLNTLYYQAGAGIVAQSDPVSERNEVDNKLGALRAALKKATEIYVRPKSETSHAPALS